MAFWNVLSFGPSDLFIRWPRPRAIPSRLAYVFAGSAFRIGLSPRVPGTFEYP